MKQICQQSRAVWALPVQFRATALVALAHMLLLVLFASAATPAVSGADRIILRNLKIISNKTVASFDEDGIRLSDGQMLGWHDIERAKVAEDKQAAFDTMLDELGNHLYRIRQRMVAGDYEGLVSHAEAVHTRYIGRTSDTAYTVMQALMWGKLAVGQREAALAPYLRCYDILRRRGKLRLPIPGERRLVFDARTATTRDIAPVWFDAAAAKDESRISWPPTTNWLQSANFRFVNFGKADTNAVSFASPFCSDANPTTVVVETPPHAPISQIPNLSDIQLSSPSRCIQSCNACRPRVSVSGGAILKAIRRKCDALAGEDPGGIRASFQIRVESITRRAHAAI